MGDITVNNGVDSGGTLAATLSAFATYLNTLVDPRFAAITWSADATHVIGTSDTAGVGISFTAATTGTGATANTVATTTANVGPCEFGLAANWKEGVVPVSGDTIIFDGTSDYPLLFGLDTGIYFNLRIDQAHTQPIGLGRSFTTDVQGATISTPEVNEMRTQYLTMTASADAVSCDIGRDFGLGTTTGSGRIKINFGGATPTVRVWNSSATATDDGLMPIQFMFGTNPYATLYVQRGMMNIGAQSETCNILECNVADTSSFSRVVMGTGVSCPTFKANGGSHIIQTIANLAITNNGAQIDVEGNTTIVTNTVNKGTTNINGAVTVTTSTVKSNATLCLTKTGRAVVLTNIALSRGAILQSGPNVTHTNPPTYPDGPYQVQVQ